MIYFMQAADGGAIKIGSTADLRSRKKQLECQYCRTLVVLATMEGGRREELEIHEKFAHLRLPRRSQHGPQQEQFRPGDDLMNFINMPPASKDEVETCEPMLNRGSFARLCYGQRIAGPNQNWTIKNIKIDNNT